MGQVLKDVSPERRRMAEVIEERLRLLDLFDLYGNLLTDKQQECIRMYLMEDFSLTEIGESLGISRQAVYDNIHRSEKALEEYETKLGMSGQRRSMQRALNDICRMVEGIPTSDALLKQKILERLSVLSDGEREGIGLGI